MDNFDVNFTGNINEVKTLLLSLNNHQDFDVKELSNNKLEVVYDGGYNNVYNHKCIIEILNLKSKIKGKDCNWYYWDFKITSEDFPDYKLDVDNLGWNTGFLDFFIDDYIKNIGILLTNIDY